jgi:hypothetical protein
MPRAVDGTCSVPNTFSPHTVAVSSQVNANHTDHATVAETFWGNLLIGGDFTTNPWQRGTTFTSFASGYAADRWRVDYVTTAVFDVLKTADAPTIAQAGIYTAHCLHIDVTTADAAIAAGDVCILSQSVEGLNAAVLGFGQAGARSATLSFWVKSSKTGVHCVALRNAALDRSYVAEYTVSAADTWERKTVTIAGDTSGTWLATNGVGLSVVWALAAGTDFQATAGAWGAGNLVATANQVNVLDDAANNFKIALAQLEVGTQARPFDARPADEVLRRCQRYYAKSFNLATAPVQNAGVNTGEEVFGALVAAATFNFSPTVKLPVTMRAAPTVTLYNPAAANAEVRDRTANADCTASAAATVVNERGFRINCTANAATAVGNVLAVHWAAAAEL